MGYTTSDSKVSGVAQNQIAQPAQNVSGPQLPLAASQLQPSPLLPDKFQVRLRSALNALGAHQEIQTGGQVSSSQALQTRMRSTLEAQSSHDIQQSTSAIGNTTSQSQPNLPQPPSLQTFT